MISLVENAVHANTTALARCAHMRCNGTVMTFVGHISSSVFPTHARHIVTLAQASF